MGLGDDALGQVVGQEDGVGLGQLGAGDLDGALAGVVVPFGGDVEPREEGLVVATLGGVVGRLVDGGYVFGQFQRHAKLGGVQAQPLFGFGQGLLGGANLALQPLALLTEGIGRDVVALLGMELEQADLLGFELGHQGGLGVLDLDDGGLADGDQGLDGGGALGDVLAAQLDRMSAVVVGDGLVDEGGADVGAHGAATAVDAGLAEEVGVLLAVAAGGLAVDQAMAALAAEDRAAQIGPVDLRTFASDALFIEAGLDAIEGLLVDQRLMAAREDLLVRGTALVDDPAGVVGVAQQPLQHRGAELGSGPALGGPGANAEPIQLLGELGDGILAAVVKLEGQGCERAALGIDLNGGNAAAVRQQVDAVEVAEGSGAAGAAAGGFLAQAALDALAGQHRLVLVVGHDHALIEEARGGVLAGHRLGDRDQTGAGLPNQLAGLPVVNGVARPTRQRPDDHVVHARGLVLVAAFQLIEHVEEAGALMQIDKGALARVGVLSDDGSVELRRLVGAGLALGADRQAVRVIVGLHLAIR